MKFRPTFRTIWKIDALLILVVGIGACVLLGILVFSTIRQQFAPRDKGNTVKVEPSIGAQWRLGQFETIGGFIVAPVFSAQTYAGRLSTKEATATRNYLFVSSQDKSTRWLIPDNDHLILDMQQITSDGSLVRPWENKGPAKWLVLEVVSKDTNGDGRLTVDDQRSIAIADADGTRFTEVLTGVNAILGRTWSSGERMVIVYSAGGKNLVSEISVTERKVTVTRELPKIGH